LDKKDFFGKSDPFLAFSRANDDGTYVHFHVMVLRSNKKRLNCAVKLNTERCVYEVEPPNCGNSCIKTHKDSFIVIKMAEFHISETNLAGKLGFRWII